MKKTLKPRSKWLEDIKKNVVPNSSNSQPYRPLVIPWALKNRKKFYADSKSHSFKTQGGSKFFLLERARKALEEGVYEQEWLKDAESV